APSCWVHLAGAPAERGRAGRGHAPPQQPMGGGGGPAARAGQGGAGAARFNLSPGRCARLLELRHPLA
ncbi:hypothetical protein P7K49_006282, partial [Saguinus oedipus]